MPVCADPAVIGAYLTRREGRPPEVRETHISWVFLTDSRAYKLKKPIVLPFLDYWALEQRRFMCCEEMRLNRRLAPGVYVGVRSVIPAGSDIALSEPDDKAAIDYVVEMERYPESETLASALQSGRATAEDLRRVGARLAAFHADCPIRRSSTPGDRAAEDEIDRNALELLDLVDDELARARIREVWRFLIARARSRATELAERASLGLVREVHGDVRAEHVLLSDPVQIVDCLEFDRGLRTLDVSDELAFLVMELISGSAQTLVMPLLDGYRQAEGNCGDEGLVALFGVHRALVRAKVSFVAAAEAQAEKRAQMVTRAGRLLEVAERLTWQARQPITLVICGVPASGKSELARHLSELSGLPVLSSDVIRKQMAGLAPTERAVAGHYTPASNRRTYAELGRRARREVEQTGGAIVDATFRHLEDRRAFATELGAQPYTAVECVAPLEVLRQRSLERDQDRSRISDATSEVVERARQEWAPLDEIAAEDHLVLRSDRPVAIMGSDLTALLDRRLLDRA